MVMIENISEMLKLLIKLYDFNRDTLSKYWGISTEQIEAIAQGNVNCLPDKPAFRTHILTKIGFLYFGAFEDKDLKLSSFLEVLISYHNLSKKTIAKMAGVEMKASNRGIS